MIDIDALLKCLPIPGLQSDWVAIISGFSEHCTDNSKQEDIYLLVPPASQRVPFIDPLQSMTLLFKSQGIEAASSASRAAELYAELRERLAPFHRVRFFSPFEPETPECIPAPEFIQFLRDKEIVPRHVADFLDKAMTAMVSAPIFEGPDNFNEPWAMEQFPDLPPAKAMIEFVPGGPWVEIEENESQLDLFKQWRESMRPIAERLEKTLGVSVYHFADPDCDTDDDNIHRFLVLHWCCSFKPESSYVKYLVEISGAKDVEELKSALIDPKSYKHPYEMFDAFRGLESGLCRIEYLPPDKRKTVAIVFATLEARTWAESLLLQHINFDALIVAPEELVPQDWVRVTTRHCRSWDIDYMREESEMEPITILARVDKLCIIANEITPGTGCDLKLTESVEDLLWLALELEMDVEYFYVTGTSLYNPDACLRESKVPERVTEMLKRRRVFTAELKEISVFCDYYSSGLWGGGIYMLSYDDIDLPFPLARRIAAWQRDFDETQKPPDQFGDDAWCAKHYREGYEIAKELQSVLGPGIIVKTFHNMELRAINEIETS